MDSSEMLATAQEMARAAKIEVALAEMKKEELDALEVDSGLELEDIYIIETVDSCDESCCSVLRFNGMFCHCQSCGTAGVKLTRTDGYCSKCRHGMEDEALENPMPAYLVYTYHYIPGTREVPDDMELVELHKTGNFCAAVENALQFLVKERLNAWGDAKADEAAARADSEYVRAERGFSDSRSE